MNIRETFIALTLATTCVAAKAADPLPSPPPAAAATTTTNSPEEIMKMGSYAWGVGNAESWMALNSRSYVPWAKDLDPEEVARGIVEGLRGKKADGSTNLMTLPEASAWIKKVGELTQTILSNKAVAFLEENKKKPGVVTLPDGLQYKVIREGKGASPTLTNSVKLSYVGRFVDGKEFENTYTDPRGAATLDMRGINSAAKGWAEAIMLMKEGGKLEAYMPPSLGYGARPRGHVPPNSTLIFEMELLSVTNQPPPVALKPPANGPPPGARIMNSPTAAAPQPATSPILQVNPDGTHKILPPDATAPAPPPPPVPGGGTKP